MAGRGPTAHGARKAREAEIVRWLTVGIGPAALGLASVLTAVAARSAPADARVTPVADTQPPPAAVTGGSTAR